MNLSESLGISWRNIRDHPLRSGLTTLGVIIGVAAVILFVTLSASLQAAIGGDFQFGSPQNIWLVATPEEQQGPGFSSSAAVFSEADRRQLMELADVAQVVPVGSLPAIALSFEDQRLAVNQVTATSPGYFPAEDREFARGESFATGEAQIVLSESAVSRFNPQPQLGERLVLTLWENDEDVDMILTGVLADQETGFGLPGPGRSGNIFIPYDPFHPAAVADGEAGRYSQLVVVARDVQVVRALVERVEAYLHDASDAAAQLPAEHRFQLVTNELVLDQIQSYINTFTGFITSIALISLVVGSIGIANIMLVSVTERTREIGIMKALGAMNRDVLVLFLSEAVIIGALGSLLGGTLGVGGAYLVAGYIDLPFRFPLVWAGAAVLVGITVGILSGLYPAWKAARVDPIDALRYE